MTPLCHVPCLAGLQLHYTATPSRFRLAQASEAPEHNAAKSRWCVWGRGAGCDKNQYGEASSRFAQGSPVSELGLAASPKPPRKRFMAYAAGIIEIAIYPLWPGTPGVSPPRITSTTQLRTTSENHEPPAQNAKMQIVTPTPFLSSIPLASKITDP